MKNKRKLDRMIPSLYLLLKVLRNKKTMDRFLFFKISKRCHYDSVLHGNISKGIAVH